MASSPSSMPGDPGFADRQRPQDQRAQRNRLVAGHADAALERAGAAGGQRRNGCGGVHGGGPAGICAVLARQDAIPRDAIDSGIASGQGKRHFFRSFRTVQGFRTVAKPELGTKRLCGSCGAKFYDLSKDPIICPKCGTTFVVVAPVSRRGRRSGRRGSGGRGRCGSSRGTRTGQGGRGEGRRRRTPNSSRSRTPTPRPRARRATPRAEGDDDIEVEETEEAPFIEETGRGRRRRHRHHRRRPRGRRGDLRPVRSILRITGHRLNDIRGHSSAGRALAWHARGRRFDPAWLHQPSQRNCRRSSRKASSNRKPPSGGFRFWGDPNRIGPTKREEFHEGQDRARRAFRDRRHADRFARASFRTTSGPRCATACSICTAGGSG